MYNSELYKAYKGLCAYEKPLENINQNIHIKPVAKNHLIKFRVTATQKQKITEMAHLKGHVETSSYVRERALVDDTAQFRSIENNKILKQMQEDIQWMKRTLNGLKS